MKRAVAAAVVVCGVLVAGPAAAQEVLGPQEVIRELGAHNPEVQRAQVSVRRSSAELRSEAALRVPQLSASAQYLHSDEPTQGLFENGVRISDTLQLQAQVTHRLVWGTDVTLAWAASRLHIFQPFQIPGGGREVNEIGPNWDERLTLTLRQPLLRGFGRELNTLNVETAQRQLQLAEIEERRAASAALFDALTRYIELVYTTRNAALQRRQRELLLEQREATAALVEAGRVAATELDVLEQRLLTLDEGLLAVEQEQRRQGRALAVLLGAAPGGPAAFSAELPRLPPVEGLDVGALEEQVWASSPELAALEEQAASLRLQRLAAEDATRPQLDLTATVGQRGLSSDGFLDASEQVFGLKAGIAGAGVTLQVPLDNDRAEEDLTAARIALEDVEIQRAALRRELAAQLRDAVDAAQAQGRRRALAERASALAERNLEAERARYTAGRSTNQAVLQFQADLEQSQLRALRAEVDEAQATLRLLYLTGRVLEL